MKLRRTLRTIALTAALGLGVWTLAFTFTSASFSDGDILSAEALNTLLNDNFGAVESELERLDDTKLSIASNGNVSRVVNFRANSSNAAVSIKNSGSGHLLQALGSGGFGTAITNNGDILLGPLTSEGAETIRISAAEGTITNDVGSGLPLAFGYVNASGGKLSGTDNFAVRRDGDAYRISFTGETYSRAGYATMVQGMTPGRYDARADADTGDLIVEIRSSAGNLSTGAFHFVTFKDGK